MTNQVERVYGIIDEASIGLAGLVAVLLDHMLSAPLKTWSSKAAVLFAAVGVLLFRQLARMLLAKSMTIRKLISGSNFVEGIWVEIYPASGSDAQAKHVGVIAITFAGDGLSLSGITFDGTTTFSVRGGWESQAASYDKNRLTYAYTEDVGGRPLVGSGRLEFKKVDGYPVHYQSRIYDPVHSAEVLGIGAKVENREDIRALRTGHGRDGVLRKYVDGSFLTTR